MQEDLCDLLVDPTDQQTPLKLEISQVESNGEIRNGILHGIQTSYPIQSGIPRFVETDDEDQHQTEISFSYKWKRQGATDSEGATRKAQEWLLERYGFDNVSHMREYLGSRGMVLDAGCGSGFSTAKWIDPSWRQSEYATWVGVDISTAIDVARERLNHLPETHFLQADILRLPFPSETFDCIFSEGVLHHTPSTEQALKALVPLLKPGGEIMFYVYRQKGPVREFTDDYIREQISHLDLEVAWDELLPLTKLAQSLSDLNTEVEVPEDIPLLGISAGRHDVQRLLYWNFLKIFWDADRTFEENNAINFDWFRPQYAHRHTEHEVRTWCEDSNLSIIHFDVQQSGITVRALKE